MALSAQTDFSRRVTIGRFNMGAPPTILGRSAKPNETRGEKIAVGDK